MTCIFCGGLASVQDFTHNVHVAAGDGRGGGRAIQSEYRVVCQMPLCRALGPIGISPTDAERLWKQKPPTVTQHTQHQPKPMSNSTSSNANTSDPKEISHLGWRLMTEIDRSLLALAQALTAAQPERMENVLKKIESAATAIRQAQQSKTAEAMWEAWKHFTGFRDGIWSDLHDIERMDHTPLAESHGWKIVDGAEWMTPTLRVWVETIFKEQSEKRESNNK